MKVAIVHYWILQMRGGEKVLEALCEMYPDADIFCLQGTQRPVLTAPQDGNSRQPVANIMRRETLSQCCNFYIFSWDIALPAQ